LPIHFFDSPIPSRPTFCLSLVDFDAKCAKGKTAGAESEAPDERPFGAPLTSDRTKPIARSRAEQRIAARRPDAAPSGDPQPGDDIWDFISMAAEQACPGPLHGIRYRTGERRRLLRDDPSQYSALLERQSDAGGSRRP
jgi:hypothetical protein